MRVRDRWELNFNVLFISLLRLDQQNNQITPDDKLTVLCEITIDGKDIQQSGQARVSEEKSERTFHIYSM